MKLLWLFVVLPAVLGQNSFGKPYLKNSRLCRQWDCLNTKLGFPDSLPSREESENVFRNLLPEGPWQEVVGQVLDNCYQNRTRRFTNTCPGQALMHCVVDQMIDFCPVAITRKDDSCSPVSSLAGLRYMFSQSRYINLEKSLPRERRPAWFLKNYFDSKCCDLPVIFNTTVLEECGFSSFMNYFNHGPMFSDVQTVSFWNPATTPLSTLAPELSTTEATAVSGNRKPVTENDYVPMPFDFHIPDAATTPVPTSTPEVSTTDATTVSGSRKPVTKFDYVPMPFDFDIPEPIDPLDCCEMTKFIDPSWRSECGFHLNFKGQERLVVSSHSQPTEAPTTSTTERTNAVEDLMLVPHSCAKETCVFQRLGIVSDTGILDIDGYMKMLQNFTDAHPAWTKAKARVLTKCLAKPVRSFETGCEINNMLACTLDVLTENCPYKRKSNICKHGNNHDVSCQISSSRFRPKNRREVCLLPELIHRNHLQECGLETLYKVRHVAVPPKTRKYGWFSTRYTCKDSAAPTTCLMRKMGVLNKYNFMDYFKMKDRIRQFTKEQPEWAALKDTYMSAFINLPMYSEHCTSEKKLLNVIDAMLMTCPISKRKNAHQCNKIFWDMTHMEPNQQNVTQEKLEEIMKHYHHVFMPHQPITQRPLWKKHSRTFKKPVYDFAFLNSKDAPPVRVISLKPELSTRRPVVPPLILKPVYLQDAFGNGPVNDGVFRSNPFWIHERIAKAHSSSTIPDIHARIPLLPSTVPQFRPTTSAYQTTPPVEYNLI